LAQEKSGVETVMFYNVENLFDIQDNPLTADDEFTPGGTRRWNYSRFNAKLQNISKVILGASGWQTPFAIGLCEIENRYVLEKLTESTPLKHYSYSIIHKESPDNRGIDVAMLYRTERFNPLSYLYYSLKTSGDSVMQTREILHVEGILDGTDTLHFFFNHWPSRFSGLLETHSFRKKAAMYLKQKIDSVMKINPMAKIIAMGDFNDQPDNESMQTTLEALFPTDTVIPERIYNLSAQWQKSARGTLKFQAQWSVFDQIIVSSGLLSAKKGYSTRPENARICELPFLFEKDIQYGGKKLNRTYVGFKYHGGFSDHLPVLIELERRN
jgi:endonuclease/exonuclease/phosphatase family metal-dependent hydrolase